jgi:hypothetical protein
VTGGSKREKETKKSWRRSDACVSELGKPPHSGRAGLFDNHTASKQTSRVSSLCAACSTLSFTVSSVSPWRAWRAPKEDPRCGLGFSLRASERTSACVLSDLSVCLPLSEGRRWRKRRDGSFSPSRCDKFAGNTCKVESQSQSQSVAREREMLR